MGKFRLDSSDMSEILKVLSTDRLQKYSSFIDETGGKIGYSFIPYIAIQQASSLMYPTINFVEVCLRNRIDCTLQEAYVRFPDIMINKNHACVWYDQIIFGEKIDNRIAEAKSRAKRELSRDIVCGDIISRLTFGTWVNIFKAIHKSSLDRQVKLDISRAVFPNAKKQRMHMIINRLFEINDIRNRFFHHEPIWNSDTAKKLDQVRKEINDIHKKMLEALNWLAPELHKIYSSEVFCYEERFENMLNNSFKVCGEMCDFLRNLERVKI